MIIRDLIDNELMHVLHPGDGDRKVEDLLICDLLSWVMAKGTENAAWVTVQTHLNIVAVATLLDFSVIIHPGGIKPDEDTLKKATEEGLTVLSTPLSAYEIAKIFAAAGV